MTDRERAMLDSMREMEDALGRLEDTISVGVPMSENGVHCILRSLCRAVYVLLDWAIRKERKC